MYRRSLRRAMRLASTRIARALARLARAPWLALLVLVALHPLSSAASGGSAGLAELLRELLCGCATCAEVASPEPASCCEREVAVERDCGSQGGCACDHPDQVPLARVAPIAPANGDERAWLDATVELRQLAWDGPDGASLARAHALAQPDCRPPPDLLHHATHARRVPATRERLAWLATALI